MYLNINIIIQVINYLFFLSNIINLNLNLNLIKLNLYIIIISIFILINYHFLLFI